MPRGDGTGPEGMGAMTGRRAGYCAGYDTPGFAANTRPGRGRGFFGRGIQRGFGRNMGRFFPRFQNAPVTPVTAEEEKGYLETEINYLKDELKGLEKRLAELSKK